MPWKMKVPSSSQVLIVFIEGVILGNDSLSKVFDGIFLSDEGIAMRSLFMIAEHTLSYLFQPLPY